MKCAILQPSYLPWRGVFHEMKKVDLFIFYDDVQYDRDGWRARNKIKSPAGSKWLTIPVNRKGHIAEKKLVNEIPISWVSDWRLSHFESIKQSYSKAPFYKKYLPMVEEIYAEKSDLLVDFTTASTERIAREMGLSTRFMRSSSLATTGTKTERLIEILTKVGAKHYVSGPAAKAYMDENLFAEAGITFEYMHFSYPEYPQLYPPFDPHVTILDFLFMTGGEVPVDQQT